MIYRPIIKEYALFCISQNYFLKPEADYNDIVNYLNDSYNETDLEILEKDWDQSKSLNQQSNDVI